MVVSCAIVSFMLANNNISEGYMDPQVLCLSTRVRKARNMVLKLRKLRQ